MTSPINLYNGMEFMNTAERTSFITYNFMMASPIRPVGVDVAEQVGFSKRAANYTLSTISGMCPPPSSIDRKLSAREKIAYITYTIMSGSPITPSAIAQKFDSTIRSIELTMEKISFSLPIIKNENKKWVRITN